MFLRFAANQGEAQSGCFVGGAPEIPEALALPTCEWCRAPQTFFFQVAFPDGHPLAGQSLAAFECTECASEDALIPPMPEGPLKGAVLARSFLVQSQKNFRLLTFTTNLGVPRDGACARLERRPLSLAKARPKQGFGCLSGPEWLLDDEAPGECDGQPMAFVLSVRDGIDYRTNDGVPGQVILGLTGAPERDTPGRYQLFLGNALYFFVTHGPEHHAYCLTQVG